MRTPFAAVLTAISLAFLLPAVGLCAVEGEIVVYGGEADRPLTTPAYAPEVAEVAINSYLFFRLRTPAAGYSVAEREVIVLQRLVEVMSSGKISPVYVDEVRGAPTVYVGKFRVVTVYPADVVADGAASARALAEVWADKIHKGLLATAPSTCFGGPPVHLVSLGDKVLFRLVDPMQYESVRRRGEEVEKRIAAIAAQFDPAHLSTQAGQGGQVHILYRGDVVVTATPVDARARAAASVQALADAWAANMRTVLGQAGGAL